MAKTFFDLDLIDNEQERLEESRIKISANFQLIDDLFQLTANNMETMYLSKINTTPYVPTLPYHPVTKEYADAMASTNGGNVSLTQIFRFVAIADQILFMVNYLPNAISIFLNGIELDSTDYTATNGTEITLTDGTADGDIVRVVVYGGADVYNKSQIETLLFGKANKGEVLSLDGGVMVGAITALKKTKFEMNTSNIDLTKGNLFVKSINALTTFTLSNQASNGTVNEFILELINGGSFLIDWWSGVKWENGIEPPFTVVGTDILKFYSHDGGITWRAKMYIKDSK